MPTPDLRQREFNPLKVLHHIDRLRVLARGGDVAPVTVEIDPVAYCNHACPWCVDPAHHPVRMSDDTFDHLIDELAGFRVDGFRVEGVVFKGGGEPTLHPRFDHFVERAAEAGFSVGVVTNGSRLSDWAAVLAARAAYVRVSIDGPTPQSHARVHRSRDFEEVVAGTARLLAERGSRRHPVVGLTFAMDAQTIDLAEEAVRLGERLGADYVLLRPPFFEEVGRESTMTVAEAREVRRRLRDLAAAYRGPLDLMVGNWVGDAEQREQRREQQQEQQQEQTSQTPAASAASGLAASGRRDYHASADLPVEHRTGRCLASPVLAVVTADGSLYGCCNLRALPQWSFGRLDYAAGVGFAELWQSRQRREALDRMHRTECIAHCTHPLSRYNEIIEVLRDEERPHSQFV